MVKKRKQVGVLKKFMDDAFNYIKESRNYIYSSIILFFIFVLIGFFVIPLNKGLSEIINNSLREILLKTVDLKGIELILFIFTNNLSVALYCIIFGAVLGIFPMLNIITNGSILGYVLAKVYSVTGNFSDFWKVLPHGVFELPAIFISFGLGIKLGMFIFSKNVGQEFKYRFLNSIKSFLFVVIPLLIVAAIIEGLLITFVG
jgi:stage II sporulation protein M